MALLGVMAALTTATLRAEPVVSPGDKVKAVRIALDARAGEPGRWGRAEARLRGDGERRYFVRGLDVAAPLSVQVIAERPESPVRVSLHRHAWAAAHAEGDTGGSGLFRFDGRAHGDLGIRLVSANGETVRATLLIWQGAAVPRSLTTVYAAPGTERAVAGGMARPAAAPAAATGSAGAGLWIGVGLGLLALVGALLWWRRGRGRETAAAVLIGMAAFALEMSAPARAQPVDKPPDPFAGTEGWKPVPSRSGESKDPKPAAPKPPVAGEAPDPFADIEGWKPTPSRSGESKDPKESEAPKEPPAAESGEPAAGDYRSRIEAAEAHARDLAAQVAGHRQELERLRLLIESDREAEADPDRLPPMPLSCRPPQIEGDGVQRSSAAEAAWANWERCQQCYAEPLADFERQLLLYEKLRVLYTGTRDYVTRSIDLGDKLPKPHSLLENAWAAQKYSIRQSFEGTKKAYDAKLVEFNDRLSEILDRIGACETELNNNPMWRQTSGLFFHRTMATSYKRTD